MFAEKLELLLSIQDNRRRSGRHRAGLGQAEVYPRFQPVLPIWVAAGGNRQSVVRVGSPGQSLAAAIIGGLPEHFRPLVELYRSSGRGAGHDPGALAVFIKCHGYVADNADAAAEEFYLFSLSTCFSTTGGWLLQMSVGTMAPDPMVRSIELFGRRVAPIIRQEIANRQPAIATGGLAARTVRQSAMSRLKKVSHRLLCPWLILVRGL